jgi:hypothetical protein
MKLFFAAPLSGLPSDPTALGAQASRLHFARKLFFAAPARGLPSCPTALLSHVPCAAAEPIANAVTKAASINRLMLFALRFDWTRWMTVSSSAVFNSTTDATANFFGA